MRITTSSAITLYKIDIVLLFFINILLDIYDPTCPFGYIRTISYSGTGFALILSIMLGI